MTAVREDFGRRLASSIANRGHVCIGIDPHPKLLQQWGLSLDARGVAEFSRLTLEAVADLAVAIKPQVALFEQYGSAGYAVLEEVLATISTSGALSIADAKRGDIGSTMSAYARAWLSDESPLACDALTVSPYLGVGALDPAFDLAADTGRGVFVLARTSNPEGQTLQGAAIAADGNGPTSVAESVIAQVSQRNGHYLREASCGPFGVVVGATLTDSPTLSALGGPVLMPGVGEQGGTVEDVRRIAGEALPMTVVNVSRQVLKVGPDPQSMRDATTALVEQFRFAQ